MHDPHDLDLCTAVWASTAYLVADLDDLLPRGQATTFGLGVGLALLSTVLALALPRRH